ncbi:hypothetical protein SAMN04488600_101507 [Paenibacillus polymyxa]|nr:hypothetical protein SAMN04488600_101507 [Paenibacillus polymyxa]
MRWIVEPQAVQNSVEPNWCLVRNSNGCVLHF